MKSRKTLTLVSLTVLIVGAKLIMPDLKLLSNTDGNSTNNYKTVQAFHNKNIRNPPNGLNYIRESRGSNNAQFQDRRLIDRVRNKVQAPIATEDPIEIRPIKRTPIDTNKNTNTNGITLNTDGAVNDPGYKYEWAVAATEANKAWSLVNQQREVKVAVLDTGVDYTHDDLENRVLTDSGYNFIDDNKNVMDDNGHGTHISGIIAAEANNNEGIAGISGTLDVKIIPIKVLDANGEGQEDIIATGIRYAADNGADIINLSFGTKGESTDIESAIEYAKEKGAFVVVAAGNDNSNADLYTPAGDNAYAYTVSAITSQNKKASFSNYGSSVDIAAPGVNIISTIPDGYALMDGTSMAAPVVSGVAALLKAENPDLTPDEIAEILDSTATDILTNGEDLQSGSGLVNAYNAVTKVKNSY